MAHQGIEVELRFKVHDVPALIAQMQAKGVTKAGKKRIIDQWFAPTYVRSMEQVEDWFDKKHGVAWRIRRTEQSDGSFAAVVDSKQLTDANNHDTFKETPPVAMPYDDAVAEITKKEYRCWLTIDKTRHSFDAGDPRFEVVLDEIEGMQQKVGVGAGLEIEFSGEGTREQALQVLGEFAAKLGVDNLERFQKSFTVQSMQALANFKD